MQTPEEITALYTIPRPSRPLTLNFLYAGLILGGAALFYAAFKTYYYLTGDIAQAILNAALIEIGAIFEAIAIVKKNPYAMIGVIVSLTVSITYNYIDMQRAAAIKGITNEWLIINLAIGPVAAIAAIALATGYQLSGHETSLKKWEDDRQLWINQEIEKEQVRQAARQAAAEQAAAEQAAAEQAAAAAARKEQIELNYKLERYRIREEAKAKAEKLPESYQDNRKVTGKLPESEGPIYTTWNQIPESEREIIAGLTTREVMDRYRLPEDKAKNAFNWRKNAQKRYNNKEAKNGA